MGNTIQNTSNQIYATRGECVFAAHRGIYSAHQYMSLSGHLTRISMSAGQSVDDRGR